MHLRTAVVTLTVIIALLPAASGSAMATHSCEYPVTMTDATGTDVQLTEEPQRVVTLNPSAAQIMWEIGGKEKVVGVSKYAAYLNGSDNRTVISGEEQVVVLERVVDLEPDIVLAPNTTRSETVEKLREAGLNVFHFPRETRIEDVYEITQTVGRLTGECEGAEETVAWMKDRIGVVDETVEGQERPDALYLFFGYTAGSGTFIDEVIQTAGANNIAADVGIESYQQISSEVVVEQDPDWLILNSDDPAIPDSDAYNQTTAVKEGQVVVVQIEHLNQPAPRVVLAITKLAKHFHPEAYAAANATPTPTSTPTATATQQATPTSVETATPTETPGQPGFGIVATLVALGSGLAIATMRRS